MTLHAAVPCAWNVQPSPVHIPKFNLSFKSSPYSMLPKPYVTGPTHTDLNNNSTQYHFYFFKKIHPSFLFLSIAATSSQWPRLQNPDSSLPIPSLMSFKSCCFRLCSATETCSLPLVPTARTSVQPLITSYQPVATAGIFLWPSPHFNSRLCFRMHSSIHLPLIHKSITLPHHLQDKVLTPHLTPVYFSNLFSYFSFMYTLWFR